MTGKSLDRLFRGVATGCVTVFWITDTGTPLMGLLMAATIIYAIWSPRAPIARHPACIAPHCLRGGKCTGPCKVDV